MSASEIHRRPAAVSSEPLVVSDVRRICDLGAHLLISCREPQPCMSGSLNGPSAVVDSAMKALEVIHQSVHHFEEPA